MTLHDKGHTVEIVVSESGEGISLEPFFMSYCPNNETIINNYCL